VFVIVVSPFTLFLFNDTATTEIYTLSLHDALPIFTTTEDLAAIAREVGGDRIAVESIARGYQDPHFVEAKPSFILKLQKAETWLDRKSTRLNSSHLVISYAVFCLKKKKKKNQSVTS